jgi:hypothetical protein
VCTKFLTFSLYRIMGYAISLRRESFFRKRPGHGNWFSITNHWGCSRHSIIGSAAAQNPRGRQLGVFFDWLDHLGLRVRNSPLYNNLSSAFGWAILAGAGHPECNRHSDGFIDIHHCLHQPRRMVEPVGSPGAVPGTPRHAGVALDEPLAGVFLHNLPYQDRHY